MASLPVLASTPSRGRALPPQPFPPPVSSLLYWLRPTAYVLQSVIPGASDSVCPEATSLPPLCLLCEQHGLPSLTQPQTWESSKTPSSLASLRAIQESSPTNPASLLTSPSSHLTITTTPGIVQTLATTVASKFPQALPPSTLSSRL